MALVALCRLFLDLLLVVVVCLLLDCCCLLSVVVVGHCCCHCSLYLLVVVVVGLFLLPSAWFQAKCLRQLVSDRSPPSINPDPEFQAAERPIAQKDLPNDNSRHSQIIYIVMVVVIVIVILIIIVVGLVAVIFSVIVRE